MGEGWSCCREQRLISNTTNRPWGKSKLLMPEERMELEDIELAYEEVDDAET
jgi:hypothetical protein